VDAGVTGAELQLREFFAAEYGRLRGLGYLLTSDWAEAEELAQDALVRTYRAWSRVRRHDRPGAYARKVLVNRHRSLLRRARVEARNLAGRRGEEAVQPDLGLEGLVLWAAVRRLPARQRAEVDLLDGSGRRLQVEGNGHRVSPLGDLPESRASSEPAGTLKLTMVWRNWCGHGPVRLRWVGEPMERRAMRIPAPACADPSKPSVLIAHRDPR
jgi:DNA-directed RNA polymerase specialized sigma24 family protein